MQRLTDKLGTVEAPEGIPFGVHTVRALALGGFSRRLGEFPAYVEALLDVKIAAARANAEAAVIPPDEAGAIERAVGKLRNADWERVFPVDLLIGGGSIAIHQNVNEAIARAADPGLDPKAIRRSQSTADVCHTALHLAAYREARRAARAAEGVERALADRARAWRNVLTVSRTCLRDASPASLGDFVDGMASACRRHRERLETAADELLPVTLGGTVIGSGEGASPAYRSCVIAHLATVRDEPVSAMENLFDGAQHADALVGVSAALVALAQCWMKHARDFRLLSSGPRAGIGELRLAPVMEGSSFYPGKINPIVPETVIQCGIQLQGHHAAVSRATDASELNLNVFESVVALNLLSALKILAALAPLWENGIAGTIANSEVCRAHAGKGNDGNP